MRSGFCRCAAPRGWSPTHVWGTAWTQSSRSPWWWAARAAAFHRHPPGFPAVWSDVRPARAPRKDAAPAVPGWKPPVHRTLQIPGPHRPVLSGMLRHRFPHCWPHTGPAGWQPRSFWDRDRPHRQSLRRTLWPTGRQTPRWRPDHRLRRYRHTKHRSFQSRGAQRWSARGRR